MDLLILLSNHIAEMKAITVNRKIIAFLFFLVFLVLHVYALEKIYVFFPSAINTQSMQNIMAEQMKNANIIVFGRYNEFMTRIKSEPPDAVITKTMLIKDQLNSFEILLNGERNGKTVENYVILSTEGLFDIDSVSVETVIGVIDILGRTAMSSFSKQFFPAEPKLKRVSKLEDLLSLLSFDLIAGIMVEEGFTEYFKSVSKLQFNITPLNGANTGIVAFAVKKGSKAEKTSLYLKKNDKKICDLFQIEKWK